MNQEHSQYLIDGERYLLDGLIRFAEGLGEGRSESFFCVLRHEETGEICYLEKGYAEQAYLHWTGEESIPLLPEGTYTSNHKHAESQNEREVDILEGDEVFSQKKETFSSIQLTDHSVTEGAWGTFADARYALLLSGRETLLTLRLIHERDAIYSSEQLLAADTPRFSEPRHGLSAMGQMLWPFLFAFLLFAGFSNYYSLFSESNIAFSRLFFYGGFACWVFLLFGRDNPLHASAQLWASAFALFLSTSVLSNYIEARYPDDHYGFLIWQGMACLTLFAALRFFSSKAYAMLSRTALTAGGMILALHFSGVIIVSCTDEYWWGSYFFWYLGHPIYGSVYLLLFLVYLGFTIRDYLYVPIKEEDFIAHIKRFQAVLLEGLSKDTKVNPAEAELCDDLADSIQISVDYPIASYAALLPFLRRLTKVIQAYPHIHTDLFGEEDIRIDFSVIAEDLQDLIDQLHASEGSQIMTPRISARLRLAALDYELSQQGEA